MTINNNFIIVVGSHNNEQWIESNIASILCQDYWQYKVLYFEDGSTDKTREKVMQKVGNKSQFVITTSDERKCKTWFFKDLGGYEVKDNDILVFLDGDDMFACENVLSYLNSIYNETQCWMTYGGMAVWDGKETKEPFPQNSPIPDVVSKNKAFRQDMWRTSHLKTMRGFVWNRFNKNELMPEGKPLVGPDDLAIMFAALEQCPPQKVYRVKETIYLYNEVNSSRCYLETKETIGKDEGRIRHQTPYPTIPVVCPTLAGGLGNQMFEIAAAASLAEDNNALLVVNPEQHILPNQGRNVVNYVGNIFSKIVFDSNPPIQTLIQGESVYYKPIEYKPNCQLQGHFQSYKYFHHNKEYISQLFAPSREVMNQLIRDHSCTANPMLDSLFIAPKVTAIQVRRGDYIKFPDHHPLLPPDYYHKAVKMTDCETVWIFSDDLKWCKENLDFGHIPVGYIKADDFIELYLMGFCKNLVISNSSFGWWAAYLGGAKVFVPSTWFGPALIKEGFKMEDLILPEWNIVNL